MDRMRAVVRVLAVIVVLMSLIAASMGEVSADHKPDHQPQGQGQSGGNGGGNEGGNEKVIICHATGNGSYQPIEVAQPAVEAHMAHGDASPGAGGTCPVAETPPTAGGDQPEPGTGMGNPGGNGGATGGDGVSGGDTGGDDTSGNPNQDDAADPCEQPSACGEIAIFKFMCEEIGQRNTCNGRVTSLAGYDVDFTVVAADVPGNTAQVPEGLETITVTLGLNANEKGNTGNGSQGREVAGPYPLGTYLVCEVPTAYNDGDEVALIGEARPTAGDGGSTGGTRQEAIDPDGEERQGTDCIQVELTPGRAELKFVDAIAPESAGGEVDNGTGGNVGIGEDTDGTGSNGGTGDDNGPEAVGGVSEEPAGSDDGPEAVGGVSTGEDAESDSDLAAVTALPATGAGAPASPDPGWSVLLLALAGVGLTSVAMGVRRTAA